MSKQDFYIKSYMNTHRGTRKCFNIHPVLYALVEGGYELTKQNRHFFGLVTGGVGDGKTNLATQLMALWEKKFRRDLNIKDNFVWTTEKFTLKTDSDVNKTFGILWDEAIQGATGKNMALTSEGELLKISLVTKRFKKHFYLLLIDEVEEYAWKLIKMCNFWIHVKTKYTQRGYFDCYLDKKKIKLIYQAFKYYKWDWSRITIKPDFVGKHFFYFEDLIEPEEYDKTKIAETQVNKKDKAKDARDKEKQKRVERIKRLRAKGFVMKDIAEIEGTTHQNISYILQNSNAKEEI